MDNPYDPPRSQRHLPTLHWRESLSDDERAASIAALNRHCADTQAVAADHHDARPQPRGLGLTLASLGGTALVASIGICSLGLILVRDRELLLLLATICAGLGLSLILVARSRLHGDRRHAEDDRSDPVLTMRAWLEALSHGSGAEIRCRLAPSARALTIEAPDVVPHRSRAVYPLAHAESVLAWARTCTRSDPIHPRWLLVRNVELDHVDNDLAWVRIRLEFRWWPLWGVVMVGGTCLPLLFFALIPGLILYLALMQRRVVVATKAVMRGSDGRWYVVRPELVGEN